MVSLAKVMFKDGVVMTFHTAQLQIRRGKLYAPRNLHLVEEVTYVGHP